MDVIDFHSHILPEIDDGSKDLPTSLLMLKEAARQGVDTMVATPHFYAWRDRMDPFLKRRREAFSRLAEAVEALDENEGRAVPKIRVGAEVAFFEGISRSERLDELSINGTDLLLVELPFHDWDGAMIEELGFLAEYRKKTVILAHLERYLSSRENRGYIRALSELPLYVQVNAEGFADWRMRGRLLKMIRNKQAHLLGSDCHGMHRRPPNLRTGRDVIQNKLGAGYLKEIDELGTKLLATVI